MTTQTEALKLALEALENIVSAVDTPYRLLKPYHSEIDSVRKLIPAIKEALAQQCVCGEPNSAGTHRTDGPCLAPQPEQEPVAWMYPDALCDRSCLYLCTKGFTQFPECATTPPQRTWVGLTDEEIAEIEDGYVVDYRIPAGCGWNFAKDIEAKLKEKNA